MFPSLETISRISQKNSIRNGGVPELSKVRLENNLQEYFLDSSNFYITDGRAFLGRKKKHHQDANSIVQVDQKHVSQVLLTENKLWEASGLMKPGPSVKLKKHLSSMSFSGANMHNEDVSPTRAPSLNSSFQIRRNSGAHNRTKSGGPGGLEKTGSTVSTAGLGRTNSSFFLRQTASGKRLHTSSKSVLLGGHPNHQKKACLLTATPSTLDGVGFWPGTPLYSPLVAKGPAAR